MKYIITERVRLHRFLESQKPMILRFEATQAQRPEDTKFCEDYRFYSSLNSQVLTHFQEAKEEVTEINDKAHSCMEQMDFQVQFLEENTTIREDNEVVVEVKHLLHSLMVTEDVNSY